MARPTTERIHFRLMVCQECSFVMCWVNPRFPNYCPECGKFIYSTIRGGVVLTDENATLKYDGDKLT